MINRKIFGKSGPRSGSRRIHVPWAFTTCRGPSNRLTNQSCLCRVWRAGVNWLQLGPTVRVSPVSVLCCEPKTVTHPSTNRARRALTSFMRRTPLTTTPRRQMCSYNQLQGVNTDCVSITTILRIDWLQRN